MLRKTPRSIFLAPALLLLLAASASGAILDVNCAADPFDLINMVSNANNGDTLVVISGPCIGPISILGFQDLHIVAANAAVGFVGANPMGTGSGFSSPVILDGSFGCVTVTNSARISITGFEFHACVGSGIVVDGSVDVRVQGNRIDSALNAGVLTMGPSARTTITGNTIMGSGGGIILGSNRNYVADNDIQSNAGIGIRIDGNRNIIFNNEVLGNSNNGIHDTGNFSRIERNTSLSNGGFGIFIDSTSNNADVVGNATGGSIVIGSAEHGENQ